MTTERVARRAKVSRVTGYRRFWDRHALVTAKMTREGRRIIARVTESMASAQPPSRSSRHSPVRSASHEPVLSRTALLESGELIAAGLADDAALLRLGSTLVADGVQGEGRLHRAPPGSRPGRESVVRLFAACVLLPALRHRPEHRRIDQRLPAPRSGSDDHRPTHPDPP
ncbi:hypothetical protein ACIBG0_05055 [Nocardia sp. NPDC050630]|uniref:hypothetical protein n=1 Tax=Nocardia sp. NPDC050630 TaxID=3364321 RepID=UPI0037B16685